MASETLGWWLGAAPGFAIALRTWWRGLQLESRLSAAAIAERKWAEADLSNSQKVSLWVSPHRFIGPSDSPAIVEAKKAILVFRSRALWGMWGGGLLAFVGGVIGVIVSGRLA